MPTVLFVPLTLLFSVEQDISEKDIKTQPNETKLIWYIYYFKIY